MGVKDLWTVLSPVCERKSLYELQGKSIAVDLSCWVVEGQNVAEYSTQPRMYLRNLFFRTTCLLLLGVKPIFVLEGSAPILKHDTMAKRNEIQSKHYHKNTQSQSQSQQAACSQASQSSQHNGKKGSRSRLKSLSKQCEHMLRILGVCCIQSSGEAEALCAQLNELGLVDGCITQDGDCFLYGATTVYRNFTISAQGTSSSSGYSVDVYKMSDIQAKLRLSREKLVALSLICGCDYGSGVNGVGKQQAGMFLDHLDDEELVLERLKRWRTDPYFELLEVERMTLTTASVCDKCCHPGKIGKHETAGCKECGLTWGCRDNLSQRVLTGKDPEDRKIIIAELNLRKKALMDPDFPSQDMINEFLQRRPKPKDLDLDWKEPNLAEFIKFADRLLSWTETYAVEKFLPLVTRWQLTQRACPTTSCVSPRCIVKTRVQRGVACYEVRWHDNTGLVATLNLEEGVTPQDLLVTVEPQTLVVKTYPDLVETFLAEKEAAKKAKRKPRATKKTKAAAENAKKDSVTQKDPLKQLSLNQFVQHPIPSIKPHNHISNLEVASQPWARDDSQKENTGTTKTRKKRATSPKPKTTSKGTQRRPQVTIASLMRKVQTIEKSNTVNHRINDIMCNPVKDVDNVFVKSKMNENNNLNSEKTCVKRYGSPGVKVGLKNRKIIRHNSTPKKLTSTMYHLENSFKSMSLVDDLDDLDSNDDISDLSALIDSIVGMKNFNDVISDGLEIESRGSSRCKSSPGVGSRKTRELGLEINTNIDTIKNSEDFLHRRPSDEENYDTFQFELMHGRGCATPLDVSLQTNLGEDQEGLDQDNVISESIGAEFEKDEFDISTDDYLPLCQRIQAQSS